MSDNTSATPPTDKTWFQGNCHCAAIKFRILLPSTFPSTPEVINCNCSICTKNGYLNILPAKGELEWLQGYDGGELKDNGAIKAYSFGNQFCDHVFCVNCGSSFAIKVKRGEERWSINVRMIKDVQIDKLVLKSYDGMNQLEPKYEV